MPRNSFDIHFFQLDMPRNSFDGVRNSFDVTRNQFDIHFFQLDMPRNSFDEVRNSFDMPRNQFDTHFFQLNMPRNSFPFSIPFSSFISPLVIYILTSHNKLPRVYKRTKATLIRVAFVTSIKTLVLKTINSS